MGKGTQHKGDWKETTLQAAIEARRLVIHTTRILSNPKVFAPKNDYLNSTLNRMHELVMDIYISIWTANHIKVLTRDDQKYGERSKLQERAIEECRVAMAIAELMKGQFHLKGSKFWYWMQMIISVGKRTKAWHDSDEKRYTAKEKKKDDAEKTSSEQEKKDLANEGIQ